MIIQMILDDYTSITTDKDNQMHRILDAAVNDRIMPQVDGADYHQLKKFVKTTDKDPNYEWFAKTKYTLKTLG